MSKKRNREELVRQLEWEKAMLDKKIAAARVDEQDSDDSEESSGSDDFTSGINEKKGFCRSSSNL